MASWGTKQGHTRDSSIVGVTRELLSQHLVSTSIQPYRGATSPPWVATPNFPPPRRTSWMALHRHPQTCLCLALLPPCSILAPLDFVTPLSETLHIFQYSAKSQLLCRSLPSSCARELGQKQRTRRGDIHIAWVCAHNVLPPHQGSLHIIMLLLRKTILGDQCSRDLYLLDEEPLVQGS